MSRIKIEKVTYPDGNRIAVGSVVYSTERTCRNVYDGREFECSECGSQWHLLDRADCFDEWRHVRTPPFCPSCGVKAVEE